MQLLPGMMVYLAYKAAASVQAKVYRDKKDLQLILKKGYFISKITQERIKDILFQRKLRKGL